MARVSGGQTAASSALRAWAERLSSPRMRKRIAAAPRLLEIALALALGAACLALAFSLFAPLPTPERLPATASPAVESDRAAAVTAQPFRIAEVEAAAPATDLAQFEETQLNLRLHGVFDADGDVTAFISTPDGKQGRYRAGDEIWNGVRLDRVLSSEQIVINSRGDRETLTLVNRDPEKAAQAAAIAASAAQSTQLPAFRDIIRFSVLPGADGMRLVVQPGPDAAAFSATGLRPGDLVLAVNDRPLGANVAAEQERLARLEEAETVSVTIERDGDQSTLSIDLAEIAKAKANEE
ncbi:MAG: type II secretion system protein N [Pseudomonadota bacterium]